jgi:hypothetical protein
MNGPRKYPASIAAASNAMARTIAARAAAKPAAAHFSLRRRTEDAGNQRPLTGFADVFDANSFSSCAFANSLQVLVASLNDTMRFADIFLKMQSAIWRLELLREWLAASSASASLQISIAPAKAIAPNIGTLNTRRIGVLPTANIQ